MHRVNIIASHLSASNTAATTASAAATTSVPPTTDCIKQALHTLKKPTRSLKGKTLFITGASRGIGLAIALRAAKDGANVVIAAKTVKDDPRLPGTIYSAAKLVEEAGGQALPVVCDIRSEEDVKKAVQAAVDKFGTIDICINNASAISLTTIENTGMKKYDLMNGVNSRGTYMVSKYCLPYVKKGKGHILTISPPLNLRSEFVAPHPAYTLAKMGMSLITMGIAGDFEGQLSSNCLWPRTGIATAAVKNLLGGDESVSKSRTPEIMADAAYVILTQDPSVSGNFFMDDDVLRAVGVKDLGKYAVTPGTRDEDLMPDLFV